MTLCLRQLTVENFRGVRHRVVDFAPVGITVVEGPNESGKSTLREALHTVLFVPATSHMAALRDVRPIGQQVAPRVQVIFDLIVDGQLTQVRLAKRFLERPATELVLSGARRENHTGAEAKVRLEKILESALDAELFRALFAEQDETATQSTQESVSLLRALDRAVGIASAKSDTVFEAVVKVQERYFTATGLERKHPLGLARAELADATAAVEDLLRRRAEFDVDLESLLDLEGRLASQLRRQRNLGGQRQRLREKVSRGALLEQSLGRAQVALEQRRSEVRAVASLRAERQRVVERRDRSRSRIAALEKLLEDVSTPVLRAEWEVARESAARADQNAGVAALREEAAARALDAVLAIGERHRLSQRWDALVRNAAELAELRACLAALTASDDVVKRLAEIAEREQRSAAALAASTPTLTVEDLGAGVLHLDGALVEWPSEGLRLAPTERAILEVPGSLRVEIDPGPDAATRRGDWRRARADLDRAFEIVGVTSLAEAHELAAKRRELAAELRAAERRRRELLGSDVESSLESLVQAAERRVGELVRLAEDAARAASLPSPHPSTSEAEARALVEAARNSTKTVEAARTAARALVELRARTLGDAERRREEQAREMEAERRIQADLDRELHELPDDSATSGDDPSSLEALEAECARWNRELDDLGWQERQRDLSALETSIEALRAETQKDESALAAVRERIRIRSDEGLHELLSRARSRLEDAEARDGQLRREAAHVRRLHRALSEAREAARTRYAEPLRSELVRLGREVLGQDFDVELSPQLVVETRTWNGCTLPFAAMSLGAREQVVLLTRLAMARIVGRGQGPVPLFLDDALAASDPDRRAAMVALLAKVGDEGQIIVLTCDGQRFRELNAATWISFGAESAAVPTP